MNQFKKGEGREDFTPFIHYIAFGPVMFHYFSQDCFMSIVYCLLLFIVY